jgi:amino acid ABC transporter membrane protein, PAAT family (TC 3.A.1.3.-)
MNGFQTMRYIVLPQAFKRMIPPLVNQAANDQGHLAAGAGRHPSSSTRARS